MSEQIVERATVYVTKHVLTRGIEIWVNAEITGSMAVADNGWRGSKIAHGEGKDWHRDPNKARIRSEHMRQRAIASAKLKIKRLEKMTFPLPQGDGSSL